MPTGYRFRCTGYLLWYWTGMLEAVSMLYAFRFRGGVLRGCSERQWMRWEESIRHPDDIGPRDSTPSAGHRHSGAQGKHLWFLNVRARHAFRRVGGRVGRQAETGFPLGVDADAGYPVSSITLEHSTVLVLYTDGITEAFDRLGEQFGQGRLVDVVQAHHGGCAAAVRDALLESPDKRCGPVQLADDVTLLIIRVLPDGALAARKDTL